MTLDWLTETKSGIPAWYKEQSDTALSERIHQVKKQMGQDLFIPGHHYQRDEVIQFADATGDSLQLARLSADQHARFIVFCGVHFMAETADILTSDETEVILPDLRAGCSMADMATSEQLQRGWHKLLPLLGDAPLPITYVNSSAAVKAFVGQHGGMTVTSSNAAKVMDQARRTGKRILFLPDQHLGRNTGYDLGVPLQHMGVWDPVADELQAETDPQILEVVLWKGHCSVHENFRMDHVDAFRKEEPDRQIIVHPECTWEVTQAADLNGSTRKIIETIENSPAGSRWAIGTEMNLVNRLIQENSHLDIVSLNPDFCPCLTMNRIDLPHLAWVLDELASGTVHNRIKVTGDTQRHSRLAIERMLAL
ncbi:quinolinate synthase NadA [Salisediminibacterium beveridgei]|uniref:Quinolinate synthase n=1 Tax=Salisediminibacterium beveridgei TaxID=632773 RepID=A0A1D7QYD0_9BACI|nr:quinolinate synthase NadA [Salisediminibacterium beveridgei]AOM84014.1 Quinolinate synthetase [Salisediminibacterium beveridgei]